jgi:PilZ domain-containing protein
MHHDVCKGDCDFYARSWRLQPSLQSRARIQSPDHMPSDHNLEGRQEKRLPIAVVVRLAGVKRPHSDGEEKTYTENVSLHGARVISRHPWQPGEEAQVVPLKYGTPARGKVVYCKRLSTDRYLVGLTFTQHPVYWSSFTYPGVW